MGDLLQRVVDALNDSDGEPDPPASETVSDLIGDWHQLKRIVQAAQKVERSHRQHLAELIRERGDLRYGDLILRAGPTFDRKVVDGPGLLEWLGPDLRFAVPASAVRITDVRKIAEQRGVTAEDTFYETVEGPPELKELPVDKAPKFLQQLKDGEHWSKQ